MIELIMNKSKAMIYTEQGMMMRMQIKNDTGRYGKRSKETATSNTNNVVWS